MHRIKNKKQAVIHLHEIKMRIQSRKKLNSQLNIQRTDKS